MTDTITTTASDIAMQLIMWLARSTDTPLRLEHSRFVMSSDDLADAYHGIPNCPEQLLFCVVAVRDPKRNTMVFAISFGHLFGLSAAVSNLNRLPELLTAAARRIGGCATWHYFDDQGALDLRAADGTMPGMTAEDFVQRLFALVSGHFAVDKCIPACYSVLHLGLINDLTRWRQKHAIRLTPRPGKVEELLAQLTLLCQLTETGVDEVASLAGDLLFFITGCYEKSSRG